jgi:hypothetical protein
MSPRVKRSRPLDWRSRQLQKVSGIVILIVAPGDRDVSGDRNPTLKHASEPAGVVHTKDPTGIHRVADAKHSVHVLALAHNAGVIGAMAKDALEGWTVPDNPPPAAADDGVTTNASVTLEADGAHQS